MWWSRAFLLTAILLLGPIGCGFHPLYGQHSTAAGADDSVAAQMADIRITPILDRNGQILRNALVERLTPQGEPATPKYALVVKVVETMSGLGQQKDSYASLGEMHESVQFTLKRVDGPVAFVGAINTVVSVNYLGPRYGSVAVERDAEERSMTEVAEEIRDQIASYLNNPASKPAQAIRQREIVDQPDTQAKPRQP